jgi:hypothetical protein
LGQALRSRETREAAVIAAAELFGKVRPDRTTGDLEKNRYKAHSRTVGFSHAPFPLARANGKAWCGLGFFS